MFYSTDVSLTECPKSQNEESKTRQVLNVKYRTSLYSQETKQEQSSDFTFVYPTHRLIDIYQKCVSSPFLTTIYALNKFYKHPNRKKKDQEIYLNLEKQTTLWLHAVTLLEERLWNSFYVPFLICLYIANKYLSSIKYEVTGYLYVVPGYLGCSLWTFCINCNNCIKRLLL